MSKLYQLFAQINVAPEELGLPQSDLGNNNIRLALQLAFGVAGGVALLIVTIAGFKYVMSQGNPQETAKAKNTILYALIGLVVCLTAFALVGFVVGKL